MKKLCFSLSLLMFSTVSMAESVEEWVQMVNQARSQARVCGKEQFSAAGPLKLNAALQRAAKKHAVDMAQKNYFDHDSLDGRSSFDRMEEEGYRYSTAGENIAKGHNTASSAIAGWLKSPGHCANMMNPNFTEMGMANSGQYWVQTFGAPPKEAQE